MAVTEDRLSHYEAAFAISSLIESAVVPPLPATERKWGGWLRACHENRVRTKLSSGEVILLDVATSVWSGGHAPSGHVADLLRLDDDLFRAVVDILARTR